MANHLSLLFLGYGGIIIGSSMMIAGIVGLINGN